MSNHKIGTEDKKRRRARLMELQGGRCYYCGIFVKVPKSGETSLTLDSATLDHVVPVSAGGVNALTNLVIACLACNQRKRNRG